MAKREVKYYPPKNFEEYLEGLANMFAEKNWSYGGITAEALKKLAEEQKKEREEDLSKERTYKDYHILFLKNQFERWNNFMRALEMARGDNRKNKTTLDAINKFEREVERKREKVPAPEDLKK